MPVFLDPHPEFRLSIENHGEVGFGFSVLWRMEKLFKLAPTPQKMPGSEFVQAFSKCLIAQYDGHLIGKDAWSSEIESIPWKLQENEIDQFSVAWLNSNEGKFFFKEFEKEASTHADWNNGPPEQVRLLWIAQNEDMHKRFSTIMDPFSQQSDALKKAINDSYSPIARAFQGMEDYQRQMASIAKEMTLRSQIASDLRAADLASALRGAPLMPEPIPVEIPNISRLPILQADTSSLRTARAVEDSAATISEGIAYIQALKGYVEEGTKMLGGLAGAMNKAAVDARKSAKVSIGVAVGIAILSAVIQIGAAWYSTASSRGQAAAIVGLSRSISVQAELEKQLSTIQEDRARLQKQVDDLQNIVKALANQKSNNAPKGKKG